MDFLEWWPLYRRREGAGFGKQNNEDLSVYNGTVKALPFGRDRRRGRGDIGEQRRV